METTKDKEKAVFESLKEAFGYENVMQAPRLQKMVISTGIGSIKDKAKIELIQDRLAKLTGQKAASRGAKKSIATYKLREGDVVGYQVTLRGQRMYDFLDKLIHIALPRVRDFHGLLEKAADEMGNYTIGIKEHTIFPETADEDLKDVFGLSITLVTSAQSKEEVLAYLKHIGLPFKKS